LVVIGLWFETPGTRPLVVAPRVPAPTARKSVAVLPFANLSNDVRNAFFARGMQDEILSDLARVADLKVISRTSVMKYEGISKRNMHEIANAIGATYVIEGSVQRVDDRIRVTAQLIDARHDAHLWADHYDREVTDVFAIQSEIASKIADQLRARLSPRERAAIRRAPTTDLRAYELYDQARNMLVWNDPQGAGNSLKRKASLLKQAIQRDPDFALAYCALAKVQDELFVALGSRMHLKAARKSLDTALRLQPNLGDAHRELGRYYYWSGELDRAYNELMAVSRIWPNDAETFRLLGEIDRENGRWRDSLDNLRKANDLDPRNGEYIHHLQLTYRLMRRYAEGLQFVNEAFARDPQYPAWHWLYLAEYKLDEGHPDQAHQALAHLPLSFSPTPEVWETRYRTALYLRDYDEASRIVAQTPKKWAAAVYIGNPPRSAADGLIARLRGNAPEAKSIFLAARKTIKHMFLQSVIYKFMEPAQYGLLDAELGRTAKAVSEARHAVDLMPVSRNSLEGPSVVGNLAVVYALTGKPDQALNQLESIIEIPAGPSYGELRFDPRWDTLRGNPRFEKMVARVKPHSN